MDTAASDQSIDQSRRRGKNKRVWTRSEDEKLVETLVELCVAGKLKSGNGFKSGTFMQIEKILEEKLQGSGLKSNPHIKSRVKTLKKHYNAISEMITRGSGFSWDDANKMIICEQKIFQEWVKGHKDAHGLRVKPFPFYDDLALVFGKDRATGNRAMGPAEVVEELDRGEDDHGLDDIEVDVSVTQPPTHMPVGDGGPKQPRRKSVRSSDTWAAGLTDMAMTFGTVMEETKNELANLVACFSHEKEAANRRNQIVDELKKIIGISDTDLLRVAQIIMSDTMKIDLFFSLNENLKKQWVEMLLRTT